ncbi:MAG: hypothetical protein HXX11_12680 [Desulfuromonadales bacterium]|nr:hypothetical protein [Desulfuromonadales bacterium]
METCQTVRGFNFIPCQAEELNTEAVRRADRMRFYRSITNRLDMLLDHVHYQPSAPLTEGLDLVLEELDSYMGEEYECMQIHDFPLISLHRLHHSFLRDNTADLWCRSRRGRMVLAEDIKYIRLLWLNHIHLHDQVLEDYLRTKVERKAPTIEMPQA